MAVLIITNGLIQLGGIGLMIGGAVRRHQVGRTGSHASYARATPRQACREYYLRGRGMPYASSRMISLPREMPSILAARV
jgi:hypothetical protein